MKLYRIADWEKWYEVSDSRKVDGPLAWVAIRTKQDGFGFRRIAAEAKNFELFGAWILMVEIAARQPRKDRGALVRNGRPLDAKSLSVMTGFPEAGFSRALEFFSDQEQAWLIAEETKPSASVRINPDQSGRVRTDSDKSEPVRINPPTGQDRTGQDNTLPGLPPADADGGDASNAQSKSIRSRNLLFDTLATSCGSDVGQMTDPAKKTCAIALSQIRKVAPDLTPEEIKRRALNYVEQMPNAAITPTALAKYWDRCDKGKNASNGRSWDPATDGGSVILR